jgi:DNA mismatch repair protein MutS
MMAQYRRIKERYPDSFLFFRLGDFYEMFEADAKEGSTLLELTLTQRQGVPMCGIPYHAAATYISRILAAGRKVAICEQMTPPGRGLVARDVLEVITPGTVLDDSYLDRGANNYLLAVGRSGDRVGVAWADLSTGEFAATSFPFALRAEKLRGELLRLAPREVITQESLLADDPVVRNLLGEREGLLVNRYPDWSFDPASCGQRLEKQLGVTNLKGFGLSDGSPEVAPAGVILEYLGETSRRSLSHIRTLTVSSDSSCVRLDEATLRNLELLANLQDGSRRYSLLEVLDQTRTSPGARALRRRILAPLRDAAAIEARLGAVDSFYRDQVLLSRLRESLARVLDLERLTARLALDRANAKDLLAIRSTLEAVQSVAGLLSASPAHAGLAAPLAARAGEAAAAVELLGRAISEEPSVLLTEGNLIRRGYDAELDRLHTLKSDARGVLDRYLQEERAATRISTLKLRYNRIIGYYFEVTKSNLSLVPPHFIRRQSLVGGERYTTDRLADLESDINDASERIVDIERTLFLEVRARVKEGVPWMLELCQAVAELDVHQSLAFAATVHGYVRPRLTDSTRLLIREGRHPVVEAHLPGGAFVPNSLELDGGGRSFVILTGPNMAGKSTFLRQAALIVLMAQAGSFVPAAEAEIGIVDAVFCRVGATDNLARGESTFLVEMNETAYILRSATPRSLLIMDEIGRGTSTRDGLAIAWAVSETILDGIHARTLFATHFHELTRMEHARVANLSMDVRDTGGEVVFLKRVREGPSDNSYGIHVARLAGLPGETIASAERILASLNAAAASAAQAETAARAGQSTAGSAPAEGGSAPARPAAGAQPLLFDPGELVVRELRGLRIDGMTPLDALNRIARWKEEVGSGGEEA